MDCLLSKGVRFEYCYSNGGKSIEGMGCVLWWIGRFVEGFFVSGG